MFNKILTGAFVLGSVKANDTCFRYALDLDETPWHTDLWGNGYPTTSFEDLLIAPKESDQLSRPYPFYLAYAIEDDFFGKHKVTDYHIEHKWDGMRGQPSLEKDNCSSGAVAKN